MSTRLEICEIASIEQVIAHIRRAGGGNPTILRENGEDVAVLIPAAAFRAVQRLIYFAWTEFPVNCWDDPPVAISSGERRSLQEKPVKYPQPGRLPMEEPQAHVSEGLSQPAPRNGQAGSTGT